MRRVMIVLTIGITAMLLVAAPALAQRDPFEPLVEPETGVPAAPGAEVPTTEEGFPQPPSEQLAGTGSDPAPWLVIAYGLVATGAAVITLAKLRSPQALLPRR